MLMFVFVVLAFVPFANAGIGFRQSIAVAGRLVCDGRPSTNTHGYTDDRGYFFLSGYHECNRILPCQKKLQVRIPDEYISRGATPQRVFHLGVLNLDGEISGEETDCFN
ncbi:Transthyretin domain containing protein [Aphelenchoides besseyi]|nr:Transthyretin domain containing protein [Aphelenchoides besseyi]